MSQKENHQVEVAKVAYELFENSGRMFGNELENWLAAEKIVLGRHAGGKVHNADYGASTKGKKSSGKTESKTVKTSKKPSESISKTARKKSPVKKKTG